jgi:hypothetical protein
MGTIPGEKEGDLCAVEGVEDSLTIVHAVGSQVVLEVGIDSSGFGSYDQSPPEYSLQY